MGQSCSAFSLKDELLAEQGACDPPSKTANTILTSKEPMFADYHHPKSCQDEQVASRPLKSAAGATAENSAKAVLAPTLLDTTDPVLSIAKAKEVGSAAVSRGIAPSRKPPSKALAAAHAAHAELATIKETTSQAAELVVLDALECRALMEDYFAEEGAGQAPVLVETRLGESMDLVVHDTSKVASLAFAHNARTTTNEVESEVPCEVPAVQSPKTIWTHFPSVGTWVQRPPVLLNSLDIILATSSTDKTWDETFLVDGTPSSCMKPACQGAEKMWDETFLIDGTPSSCVRPTCQHPENVWDETFLIDGSPSSCMRPACQGEEAATWDATLLLDGASVSQLSCQEAKCGEKHCVEQAPVAHGVVFQSRWKRLPSVGTWLINSLDPDED